MRMPRPQSRRENAADAQRQLPELLDAVRRGAERVIIEQDGVVVAALISAHDLVGLEEFEKKWDADFEVLKEISNAFKDVPVEELEREVERALAEVREENRMRQLPELLDTLGRSEERIIIKKDGVPAAALISAHDLECLEEFERKRAKNFKTLEASWSAFKDVPVDELEREVERAVREMREARRREQAEQESA